ncbi:MAG: nicotinamidase [Burkholderiaceae bacterium]
MRQSTLSKHDALLIVDVQKDFLPGGALAVPEGDKIIPVLNRYIELFRRQGLPIITTRDWHPRDHCSFKAQGGPWPPHCVADTEGAAFASALALPVDSIVISKGGSAEKEAYSGFQGTDLAHLLKEKGVSRLYIGGLATDYCVLNTVLDALAQGFRVKVLRSAVRAVNVEPGDEQKALSEMSRRGAQIGDESLLQE